MPQPLYIAPHVRVCTHGGQIVLLDLRRSRYLGVAGARFGALASIVRGWPDLGDSSKVDDSSHDDLALIAAPLLRRGLLTSVHPARHNDATLPEATHSLSTDGLIEAVPAHAGQTLRMAGASIAASLRLRWRSLESIADRCAARRARCSTAALDASSVTLRRTVAAFLRLRPLLFTTHDRCLHDSLSLLDVLAAEGWYPHWVIGVATQPFRAHAWVQSGECVINDLHEHVRRYTPILTA